MERTLITYLISWTGTRGNIDVTAKRYHCVVFVTVFCVLWVYMLEV